MLHHELTASGFAAARVNGALAGAETLIFQGTNAGLTSARASVVLPSAAYAEADGTFTNFQGRVQRFRPAVTPLGEAQLLQPMLEEPPGLLASFQVATLGLGLIAAQKDVPPCNRHPDGIGDSP